MRVLSQVISASVSATGLLTGTSTQTSATGLILQPLRSLSMFTQTANWWHQLAMLTSSRCLLGTMKMFVAAGWTGPGQRRRGAEAPSRSFRREARGASRGSAPRRASANPVDTSSILQPVHYSILQPVHYDICPTLLRPTTPFTALHLHFSPSPPSPAPLLLSWMQSRNRLTERAAPFWDSVRPRCRCCQSLGRVSHEQHLYQLEQPCD